MTTGIYAFLSGIVIGVVVAIPGWQKVAASGSLGSIGLGQVINAGRAPSDKAASALFDVSQNGPFNLFALGIAVGLVAFQGLGALAILAVARINADESDDPKHATLATERARGFFSEGLLKYHAIQAQHEVDERARREKREQEQWEQVLGFEELLTAALAAAVRSPPRSRAEALKGCRAMGAILLRNVFEEARQHRDFRFELFEVQGDALVPCAWAGDPDLPHDQRPLPMRSFLGDVISTRESDIWVKGKKCKRPYHPRTESKESLKYACFLAHPIPCDDGPPWGGFTIDYVRPTRKVFSKPRRFAVRAFARYIDIMYSLAREEVLDEAEEASA